MRTKKVKITKSKEKKIFQAITELRSFHLLESTGDHIVDNEIYQIDPNSEEPVLLTLLFMNMGVITTTDVVLDGNTLINAASGSLSNLNIGKNKNLPNKFLDIFSVLTSTTITPLPDDTKIQFTLSGGPALLSHLISSVKLSAVGDTVEIDISIIFF